MATFLNTTTPDEQNDYQASSHAMFKSIKCTPDASSTIPEGTVMGKITATELYVPYSSGASDGSETPVCILHERIFADSAATPSTVNRAAMVHGRVKSKKIICDGVTGTVDATTKAALTQIFFDDEES